MTDFLIKSSVCAFVLLLAYHLVLEREKMHRFNRFYLLISLIVSIAIPFITIEIISEMASPEMPMAAVSVPMSTQIPMEEKTNFLPYILGILYGIGFAFFSIRFAFNLRKLHSKRKTAKKIKFQSAHLALITDKVLPHTFGNTIFINETDYHNRNIEDELYVHELTHVSQKHTLDILFIEIVKTIFWFNPLFYYYKKAIQLNHEFLADEKVVETSQDIPFYQKLLLSKAGSQNVVLASNLNYSLTKKRLIMMTKTTSASRAFLKKSLLLPLLAGVFYFTCVETTAQVPSISTAPNLKTSALTKSQQDSYYEGTRIKVYNCNAKTKREKKSDHLILNKLYEELSAEEKDKYADMLSFLKPKPLTKKAPTEKELAAFKDDRKYAIWIDGKNVKNEALNNYKPSEIAYFSGSSVLKNARTKKHPQPFQFWFYTHRYFDKTGMGKTKEKYDSDTIEIFVTPTGKKAETLKAPKKVQDKIATSEIKTNPQDSVYTKVDQNAEPKGGMAKFFATITKELKIPADLKEKTRILAQFIVEKDGSLSNIKVLRDGGSKMTDETIRMLKTMEKWTPAKVNNQPVRVMYSLPISIEPKK